MLNPKTIKACPSKTLLSFILQLSPDPPLLLAPPPRSVLGSAPLCCSHLSPSTTPPPHLPRPPPTPRHALSGAPYVREILCSSCVLLYMHRHMNTDGVSRIHPTFSHRSTIKSPTIKGSDRRRAEKPNYPAS